MSTAVKIGQITQCDVYLAGNIQVGRFKDFTCPDLDWMEIEHDTLGQVAMLSLPARPLKKLTGKMTIEFLDLDLQPQLLNPTAFLPLSLNSYVDVFGSAGLDAPNGYRVVTQVTCAIRKTSGGTMKLGQNYSGDAEYSCTRFVQGIPGKTPWVEVDVINQICNVNGQPVWPTY
jgi:P2 family phage contractile tail tube protein